MLLSEINYVARLCYPWGWFCGHARYVNSDDLHTIEIDSRGVNKIHSAVIWWRKRVMEPQTTSSAFNEVIYLKMLSRPDRQTSQCSTCLRIERFQISTYHYLVPTQ